MLEPLSLTAAAPAIPSFHVVLNVGSGRDDAEEAARIIAGCFERAGRACTLHPVEREHSVAEVARRAVDEASREGGAVIAAGGDGTLNAVAQAVLGSGCAFGVIPQGTFNYFARAHGIPADTADASNALLAARPRPVRVGTVNGRVFLVNASLGLYPETLEVREEQKQRHGRRRSVAAWAAILTVLRGHRAMRIRMADEHGLRESCTLTLFIGLNPLQLRQMGFDHADGDPGGGEALTAVVLKPVSTARLLWLIARGAAGRLATAAAVHHFRFGTLTVMPANPARRHLKVATDGEISWMQPPLEFVLHDEPLLVLVPDAPQGSADT